MSIIRCIIPQGGHGLLGPLVEEKVRETIIGVGSAACYESFVQQPSKNSNLFLLKFVTLFKKFRDFSPV